jgi:Pyridoxamine 5'-phosphate oxidase
MSTLADTAPAFISMAHRIVWATVATTDTAGNPVTRVLHPIWDWEGGSLTGWILTSPNSPKARDLAANPRVSITYWEPSHDTCTAHCDTTWDNTPEGKQAGWVRFLNGPEPVGYDPKVVPKWPSPDAPEFGVLRLEPLLLRVMPGALMTTGEGTLLTWRR